MILILVKQMAQMFLLAGVGFLLYKGGKITQEGSKTLGNILIYASLPAVIINGFRVERTAEHVSGILWSAAGALVLLLVSVLISHFVFRQDPIGAFAGAFSNPGFFGVPLMIASLGQGAVFYAASFIAFLNIGQWTYGVSRLNGQPLTEGLKLKKLIQAPFVIAILAGLFLFATQIPLPDVIVNCITTLAGLNTPLAMFTVGVFLAQTDFWKMFRKKELYLVSAVRLLLVPAVSLLLLSLLPADMAAMKMVLLIAVSCPVGSNVAVYAQLHGKNYPYAVETVIISTMLSILTIPLVVHFSTMIW
ncbi:MAG: AEC family transporter [Clostridia bacterium]|nr:AEC family transporter [Clostridia bacterium]